MSFLTVFLRGQPEDRIQTLLDPAEEESNFQSLKTRIMAINPINKVFVQLFIGG